MCVSDAGHHVLIITITLIRLICTVCESEHTLRQYAGSGDIWNSGNTTEAYNLLSVKNRHQVNITDILIFFWPCIIVQTNFNNQINAQFLYSITIYMLHYNHRHVSSINMPIFRRTNCIITASGIVTLCKRLYSTPVESRLSLLSTIMFTCCLAEFLLIINRSFMSI